MESPMISVAPQPLTVAESYYDVKIIVRNIGSARNDSVKVLVKRDRADGSSENYIKVFKSLYYGDSIELKFSLDPKRDLGVQTISVSVDPENILEELSETNNAVVQKLNIIDNEVKPVFPQEFAIVNKWPLKLTASIGLFSSSQSQYIFQADT
ncbi:MAG: CARDB domain-containing protein, partial [Bacteroidota bacterium]